MRIPGNLRVLVVDDSSYSRIMARSALKAIGIADCDVAVDGIDALVMLDGADYGLVLTDWYMPNLGGAGLLRAIKDPRRTALTTLPVIVMTAFENTANIAQALTLGASDVLLKPLVPEQLGRSITRALESAPQLPGRNLVYL